MLRGRGSCENVCQRDERLEPFLSLCKRDLKAITLTDPADEANNVTSSWKSVTKGNKFFLASQNLFKCCYIVISVCTVDSRQTLKMKNVDWVCWVAPVLDSSFQQTIHSCSCHSTDWWQFHWAVIWRCWRLLTPSPGHKATDTNILQLSLADPAHCVAKVVTRLLPSISKRNLTFMCLSGCSC